MWWTIWYWWCQFAGTVALLLIVYLVGGFTVMLLIDTWKGLRWLVPSVGKALWARDQEVWRIVGLFVVLVLILAFFGWEFMTER
jgi:hypothetical protein